MNSPFSDFIQTEQSGGNAISELEFKGPFTGEMEDEEPVLSPEFSDESIYGYESPDWAKAAVQNERYSKTLGWHKHIYALNDILLKATNQSGISLGPESFAAAVAVWQGKNKLDPTGIINETTWKKMRGLVTAGAGSTGKLVTSINPKVVELIKTHTSLIEKHSRSNGFNPNLVRGIIAAESGGNHLSGEGGTGYKGLMQAGTDRAQLQPETSIAAGVQKFIAFRDKTLNPWFAKLGIPLPSSTDENYLKACLSCYNAGPVTALKAIKYAHAAGDWKQWLLPEYYQRALLFSGGYARYKECNRGASEADIEKAKSERLKYRFKTNRWRDEPDPPTWSSISASLNPFLLCWIQTKFRNTPGYLDKFIRYYKHFEANPVSAPVKEMEGYVDHFDNYVQPFNELEEPERENNWSNEAEDMEVDQFETNETEAMDVYNRERDEEMTDESEVELEEYYNEAEEEFEEADELESSLYGEMEEEDDLNREEEAVENYEEEWENESYETDTEKEIPAPLNPVTQEVFTKWHNSVKSRVNRFPKEPVYNIDQLPVPSWINANDFYQSFLQKHGNDAKIILGDITKTVMARYFVLHDTAVAADFEPARVKDKGIHLWMNAKKAPVLARDWHQDGLGVKLENKRNNSFVHIEITRDKDLQTKVQKKTGKKKISFEEFQQAGGVRSFGTYYNDRQYELLAYAYLVASLRKGKFLTITIHREVDRSVVKKKAGGYGYGHDDPQFFDLDYFYGLVCKLLAVPIRLGFGITAERALLLKQGNMPGYVNEFVPFVTGDVPAANQYGDLVRLNPKTTKYKLVKLKYGVYYEANALKNKLQSPAITKEFEEETPVSDVGVPALIGEDTKEPGYTCYVKIDIGRANIPLDTTGIYVPPAFDAGQPYDIILYLHGMTGSFPGPNAKTIEMWNKADLPNYDLRIRENVQAGGRNVIVVAPTLGKNSNVYKNDLCSKKQGLDEYMTKVMAAINHYIIDKRFKRSATNPRQLILAAHSAGGKQMRMIITGTNPVWSSRISECWGFDSLYERPYYWLKWAAANKDKKLFVYYKSSTERFAKELIANSKKMSNVFVKWSDAKNHYWVVKHHLTDRIKGIGATGLTKVKFEMEDELEDVLTETQDYEYEMENYENEQQADMDDSMLSEMEMDTEMEENGEYEMEATIADEMNLYEQQLGLLDNFAPEDDPILFYEDVKIKKGETIIGLAAEYGFDPDDWREIWKDPKNAALVTLRKLSTELREGDVLHIPIKWRIVTKRLDPELGTFRLLAERNGKEGVRLNWVQTVYGHNQGQFTHAKPFPEFSVDLPTEDDLPFYWTQREYDHLVNDYERVPVTPKRMKDRPNRPAPSIAMGATRWRAVTSICVVTNKRVSIWDTFVWGINFNPNGKNDKYEIRNATKDEIQGHLNLLRKKGGRSNTTYTALGWTFRDMNR